MSDIQTITPLDFQLLGYLQEVNRLFLHPLGLAMSVTICMHDGRDGSEPHAPEACPIPDGEWGPMWDYRIDPEGILFGEPFSDDDKHRALVIQRLGWAKIAPRMALGCAPDGVQPLYWQPN